MADHAHAGIIRKYTSDLLGSQRGAVGHGHLAGVNGAAHADPAPVMDRHPRGAGRDVHHRVQQRPVGDGIGTVLHRLGLPVRRCHRAAVEVVAADHDRGLQRAVGHHLVEPLARLVPLAVAEPADTCREALERDLLARQAHPPAEHVVVGEQLEDGLVGLGDVGCVTREGHPPERPLALAEQLTDVLRHEALVGEGPLVPAEGGFGPDRVAVVEHLGALVEEGDHALDMRGHRGARAPDVLVSIADPQRRSGRHVQPGGDVVQRVVGRGLVGHDVDRRVHLRQQRHQLRPVGHQADGQWPHVRLGLLGELQRFLDRVGDGIEVTGLDAPFDAARIGIRAYDHAAVHRDCEGLRTAHPAGAAGERDGPGKRAVEPGGGDGGEAFIGALEDALGADVDPRPRSHLAVHDEPELLVAAELLERGPLRDEVGVGEEDSRRPLVGLHHADRLARLDEQRLVVLQGRKRTEDRIEARPVAGGLAVAAVHDELFRMFGHLRIEVVLDHAERGLLGPALTRERRAPRCPDDPATGPRTRRGTRTCPIGSHGRTLGPEGETPYASPYAPRGSLMHQLRPRCESLGRTCGRP